MAALSTSIQNVVLPVLGGVVVSLALAFGLSSTALFLPLSPGTYGMSLYGASIMVVPFAVGGYLLGMFVRPGSRVFSAMLGAIVGFGASGIGLLYLHVTSSGIGVEWWLYTMAVATGMSSMAAFCVAWDRIARQRRASSKQATAVESKR